MIRKRKFKRLLSRLSPWFYSPQTGHPCMPTVAEGNEVSDLHTPSLSVVVAIFDRLHEMGEFIELDQIRRHARTRSGWELFLIDAQEIVVDVVAPARLVKSIGDRYTSVNPYEGVRHSAFEVTIHPPILKTEVWGIGLD